MHDALPPHDDTSPLTRVNGRTSARVSALAAAGLVMLMTAGSPARAQDLTSTIMTGLGLAPPDTPDINYRERAPLVVPPATDGMMLPPPRDGDALAADPAWPKDADTVRREKEKAAAKIQRGTQIDESRADGKALTPAQMAKGRVATGSARNGPVKPSEDNKDWMHPKFLDFKGWGNKTSEQPMVFAGEPERESLTQPPPGYLTPAANAPYGVVTEKEKTWSPSQWFDSTQKNKTRN